MFYSRTFLLATVAAAILVVLSGMASARAQEVPAVEAIGMMQVEGVPASVLRAARTSISGPDGVGKDGPLAAVGMELALLYHQHEAAGPKGVQAIRKASTRPPTPKTRARRERERGRLHIPISANGQFVTVEAIASGSSSQLLRKLRALGLEGGTTAGNVVSGRLPISAIEDAAALGSLRSLMPSYARTLVGDAGSEADTAHAAYKVRETKGVNGSGQKICAMSDSYNQSSSASTSPSEDVQSGDLPGSGNPNGWTTPVDVVQDSDTDESDEGRAMLQLIHDIAPGATLGFHTAFGGLAVFASGVRDLADAGCTIIVDDVRYSAEPFYQDGPVSNAVDDVVNNDGIPYFSSAGNSGQDSYEAPFRDSGFSGVINSSSVAHDFDPSSQVDTRQEITIQSGATFQIFSFQWTDPSALVQGSVGADTDFDVALVDGNDNIQAQSSRNNIGGAPVEFLEYTNNTDSEQTLYLVIEKASDQDGSDSDRVKYVYSGDDFDIQEYDTLGPTIYGHPMAKGAMAVAAAPFYNTERYNSSSDPAALEAFSSKGGIPILFRQNGTPYLQPQTRKKPEVTGTDGIDNTFFGSDLSDTFFNGVDGDSDPNFFGTSAAAPNVAAIAALIKQARPGFTPAEVYSRLEDTAEDVTTRLNRNGEFVSIASGRDPWSGHGFVQALDAVPKPVIANLQATTVDAAAGRVRLSWEVGSSTSIEEYKVERRYFDGPFEVVARPNGPSVTLDSLGLGIFTFRVRWVRSDGTKGTSAAVVDTLGVQGLSTEVVGRDEKKRRTVELSWSVPQGTKNFTYRIERQTGDEGPFVEIGSTTRTTFEAERQVPGTYNYRVTSVDEQGNSLTSSPVRRQIDFGGAAFAIGPYPNPTGNEATLDLTAQTGQTVTVELFNMLGKRVYRTERVLDARTPVTLSIDVSRWSSGMYFLRVRGEEFTKTRKMIVVQ